MSKLFVLYHAQCFDGFGAAYAMWRKFGSQAEYIACNYSDVLLDIDKFKDAQVYIVDFSFKRDVILAMAALAQSVTVLDHHKTAKEELSGEFPPNVFITFDMDRSGAAITWDYCWNGGKPGPRPALIWYIQDRDLWTWKLPASKEISIIIGNTPLTFDDFDALASNLDDLNTLEKLKTVGAELLNYQDILIGKISKKTMWKFVRIVTESGDLLRQGEIPVVNTSCLVSEVCNDLLARHPQVAFVASYYDTQDKRLWSLRSKAGGSDVAEIAKTFGGGGHKNAAGFTTEIGVGFPATVSIT